MSDILIRNAYIPKNCWDCSGRIVGDIQTFNEAVSMLGGKCPYMERIVDPREFDMHSGRHPDCPIVEVKVPHGRLIDADAIQAHEMDVFGKRLMTIDTAPTVIEAEGGE